MSIETGPSPLTAPEIEENVWHLRDSYVINRGRFNRYGLFSTLLQGVTERRPSELYPILPLTGRLWFSLHLLQAPYAGRFLSIEDLGQAIVVRTRRSGTPEMRIDAADLRAVDDAHSGLMVAGRSGHLLSWVIFQYYEPLLLYAQQGGRPNVYEESIFTRVEDPDLIGRELILINFVPRLRNNLLFYDNVVIDPQTRRLIPRRFERPLAPPHQP